MFDSFKWWNAGRKYGFRRGMRASAKLVIDYFDMYGSDEIRREISLITFNDDGTLFTPPHPKERKYYLYENGTVDVKEDI